MRRIVSLLLCLALPGCFKDDAQRLAVRNKLIELQVFLEGGRTYYDLQPALNGIETAVRVAEIDGGLTTEQIRHVRDAIIVGKNVSDAWRFDFFCKTKVIDDKCLPIVQGDLYGMGMPEKMIKNWPARPMDVNEAKDMARGLLISRLRGAIQSL